MSCICKVNRFKTKPSRSVCGSGSALYNVSGQLAGMSLEFCSRHCRQLERLGLTVIKCIPLEQAIDSAEAQRRKGLRTIAKPGEPGFAGSPA